jgi:hypothetical protein
MARIRHMMTDKHGQMAVSNKIETLMAEHMPQKQAVAVALNMKRAGRLTASGGYIRVKKKK